MEAFPEGWSPRSRTTRFEAIYKADEQRIAGVDPQMTHTNADHVKGGKRRWRRRLRCLADRGWAHLRSPAA